MADAFLCEDNRNIARMAGLLAGWPVEAPGGTLDRLCGAEPTILTDVPPATRVMHEEPFGPVAILTRFDSEEAAIAEANRLSFDLASYAFTSDLRRAERLSREIEGGSLAIDHWAASFPETPFGGVKESGLGLEGGSKGLAAFGQARFVSVHS
jgi:succinate-semialdehyde dehydrogenase/glutarate-semialdehyde dehydrogenase